MQNTGFLATSDLVARQREIAVPFMVRATTDAGQLELTCSQILRLLPAKRVVVLANMEGQQVVAKIFIGSKAVRDHGRERDGIAALVRSGVLTPEILLDGDIPGGGKILGFRFLADSMSLMERWSRLTAVKSPPLQSTAAAQDTPVQQDLVDLLDQAVGCMALMHANGIMQQDIHLDNFLCQSGQLFVIDGAGISGSRQGKEIAELRAIKNLALLFAQLPSSYDALAENCLSVYERIRSLQKSDTRLNNFIVQINKQRLKRKKQQLKKIFRDCTQIICHSGFRQFLVCERSDWNPELSKMLADPDGAIESGRSMKQGNSATVAEVLVGDRLMVIKRYNIKSFSHGLRRAFKRSRARRSWYNSHLMAFLNIPGPRPIALLEKRMGPFCFTTYYISESIPGLDARQCFRENKLQDADLQKLVAIVQSLNAHQIGHGDLKDTNFLMSDRGPVLIDLDSMREFTGKAAHRRAALKDRNRFLKNWQDQPEVLDKVRGYLDLSETSQPS